MFVIHNYATGSLLIAALLTITTVIVFSKIAKYTEELLGIIEDK
jgi:hypothetical protein